MERERARLLTDLRGQGNQHLSDTQAEGNVRHLRGRNVPIPTPPTLGERSGTEIPSSEQPNSSQHDRPPRHYPRHYPLLKSINSLSKTLSQLLSIRVINRTYLQNL